MKIKLAMAFAAFSLMSCKLADGKKSLLQDESTMAAVFDSFSELAGSYLIGDQAVNEQLHDEALIAILEVTDDSIDLSYDILISAEKQKADADNGIFYDRQDPIKVRYGRSKPLVFFSEDLRFENYAEITARGMFLKTAIYRFVKTYSGIQFIGHWELEKVKVLELKAIDSDSLLVSESISRDATAVNTSSGSPAHAELIQTSRWVRRSQG